MKKIKVNIVVPSLVQGGGLRIIFSYANYLVEQGHDVVVYVPILYVWPKVRNSKINWKTSAGNFLRGNKVKWFDNKFKIKPVFKISDAYIRNADIVIATAWQTAQTVYNLADSKGKKVYFIQGYEVNDEGTNKIEVEDSYKLGMNMFTIANWLEELVEAISGQEVKVIRNWTKDSEFIQGEKQVNDPRAIIMLGNTAAHKGWNLGLEVLKEAQEKYNCRIILYGIRQIPDLPESFEFYQQPKRELLMRLYSEADICLFPSIREGWGLTVTEAMAHKCAIVGNNTGVVLEICEDGKTALISESKTAEDLKNKLFKVIEDEKLMKKLQDNEYELAKKYAFSNQSKLFEEYLLSLVK
ncbi:glycosyltransferase family 4 protein [Ligilactobacillus salivarius]|uniref:glycosyltransferase family 4 protein n=1 Tax=Ligilactobacillus salivarius TaxID=1624 RepID=UPI00237E7980|nr:glycosyltransferase family 4 protein [Ligilactobacillus salivarius]MDE1524709.1 glycosyltransferase family 4 protein [Ligilactobacillus salivarius]